MVEIIAKDEIVAVDGRFGRETEGNAVLVTGSGVLWEGEVGGCGWGVSREAAVVLVGRFSRYSTL